MTTRSLFTFALLCAIAPCWTTSASAVVVCGVTTAGSDNTLNFWDSATPSNLITSVPVTGLLPNDTILGIDGMLEAPEVMRLFALGSSSRLYTINPSTGAATLVPSSGLPTATLTGTSFGFEHDPIHPGIFRIVSDADMYVEVSYSSGAVITTRPNLQYATIFGPYTGTDPNIVDIGHSGNEYGSLRTELFGIDAGHDILVEHTIAQGGLLPIGPLGIDIDKAGGFDIYDRHLQQSVAFAALQPAGTSTSNFYTIDLFTGAATLVGPIGGGLLVTSMAVITNYGAVPEPSTLSLIGIGAVGLLRKRREE